MKLYDAINFNLSLKKKKKTAKFPSFFRRNIRHRNGGQTNFTIRQPLLARTEHTRVISDSNEIHRIESLRIRATAIYTIRATTFYQSNLARENIYKK